MKNQFPAADPCTMQYNPHIVTDIPANSAAPELALIASENRCPHVRAIHPEFPTDFLFGPGKPPWNTLERHAPAVLIKQGKQRKIWKVPLAARQFVFAKVFDRPRSLTHLLKWKLRLHPAIREWRALTDLQYRGVPSVRPIALANYPANRPRPARTVLLTEGMEWAAPLSRIWQELADAPASTRKIHSLIAAVAKFWAEVHQKGYTHPDAHPGNILVQMPHAEHSAGPRACFIDPAFPRWQNLAKNALGEKKVLHSFALLDQHFHRTASRPQRLRFWRQYWVRRNILFDGPHERRLLNKLANFEDLHRAKLARQWDKRLRGDGKYFAKISLPGGRRAIVMLRPERPHLWQNIPQDIPSLEEWTSILRQYLEAKNSKSLPQLRFIDRTAQPRDQGGLSLLLHAHRLRHRDIPAPLILGCIYRPGPFAANDECLILPS